jgi:hypothetical protein
MSSSSGSWTRFFALNDARTPHRHRRPWRGADDTRQRVHRILVPRGVNDATSRLFSPHCHLSPKPSQRRFLRPEPTRKLPERGPALAASNKISHRGGIVRSNPHYDTWTHGPFRTTQPADIHGKLVHSPGYWMPLHQPPMRDPDLPFGHPTALIEDGL